MTNMLDVLALELNDFNPVSISKRIAASMKRSRLELNLSQHALAERSGVSLGSLKRFENSYEISLKHLLMIAVVLQATEEFHSLFSKRQYSSINEVIDAKKKKTRRRAGRNV